MKKTQTGWVALSLLSSLVVAGSGVNAMAEDAVGSAAPDASAHAESATASEHGQNSAISAPAEKSPAQVNPTAIDPAPVRQKPVTVQTDVKDKEPTDPRLFGPLSFGPVVGANIPHPIGVGLEARLYDYLGFQANYGFLPEVTISSAKAKITAYDFRARVFPFGGAFFLGASIGKQKLKGSDTRDVSVSGVSVPTGAEIEVNTTYCTPQIGWRWGGTSGFIIGMDFGVQLALSSTSAFTSNAPANVQATSDYQKLSDDVNKVGKDVGKQSLPHWTVVQIGYLF